MTSLQDNIDNIRVFSGKQMDGVWTDGESIYTDRKKQYLAHPTTRFVQKYAKYASDYFEAEVQGLNPEDFYDTGWYKIRASDLIGPSTSTNIIEGYKNILFENPAVDYVPRGAKLMFLNSTWLAVNPSNSSSVSGNTVARLCDANWKFYDYYGNIVSEPFCLQKVNLEGSQNDYTKYMVLADNYSYCLMQYNKNSKNLRENTRMILGDAAYAVRGLNNFSQEFTNDEDSIHMIYFVLYRDEPSMMDDMVNKVADAGAFSWNIFVTGNDQMTVGQTQQLTASSLRNGIVPDTTEYPVSYLWSSSDDTILTVDEQGNLEAKAEGTAIITVALEQNPAITAEFSMQIEQATSTPYVAFTEISQTMIAEGESATIRAAGFTNNAPTGEIISFVFSGPSVADFSSDVNGNAATVTCWRASDTPLTVTATGNSGTATCELWLIGR